ncbi:MAG TPA: hypothetical protein VGA49_01180 [Patescibacteria group bacterium]
MVEDFKDLIEKSLKLQRETLKLVKKIRRSLLFSRILGIIFIIMFIVLPVVAAFTFLPPFLKNFFAAYDQILRVAEELKGLPGL